MWSQFLVLSCAFLLFFPPCFCISLSSLCKSVICIFTYSVTFIILDDISNHVYNVLLYSCLQIHVQLSCVIYWPDSIYFLWSRYNLERYFRFYCLSLYACCLFRPRDQIFIFLLLFVFGKLGGFLVSCHCLIKRFFFVHLLISFLMLSLQFVVEWWIQLQWVSDSGVWQRLAQML